MLCASSTEFSILSKNYNLFLKIIIFFIKQRRASAGLYEIIIGYTTDPISCTLFGADRDRTCDILLAKQTLSQLSYSPKAGA
jgi:hypothetical protein